MTPEDELPAHVLSKRELAIGHLEVLRPKGLRDVGHLTFAVDGESRFPERFVVGIGRVDLHALVELIDAKRFGENHRQRVRLFTGGTPRAPDANAVRRRASLDEVRKHGFTEELPARPVAKETRDVDEHRVEQQGEFVGMHLEVVEVVAIVRASNSLEPLRDASLERGPLISGEIESARTTQVFEEWLELRILGHGSTQR